MLLVLVWVGVMVYHSFAILELGNLAEGCID